MLATSPIAAWLHRLFAPLLVALLVVGGSGTTALAAASSGPCADENGVSDCACDQEAAGVHGAPGQAHAHDHRAPDTHDPAPAASQETCDSDCDDGEHCEDRDVDTCPPGCDDCTCCPGVPLAVLRDHTAAPSPVGWTTIEPRGAPERRALSGIPHAIEHPPRALG